MSDTHPDSPDSPDSPPQPTIGQVLRTLADQFETNSLSKNQKQKVINFVTSVFAEDVIEIVAASDHNVSYSDQDLLRFFSTGWYIHTALKTSV
jgi:hypothetical protein